jgi:hypothetical protein
MAKNLSPEQKRAKRVRYQANRTARDSRGERHTTPGRRPPEEQTDGPWVARGQVLRHRSGLITGDYDATHLVPRHLGGGRWLDPGLVCPPDEPYGGFLMPLWPGHDRRRQVPVRVKVRPDSEERWLSNLKKRARRRDYRAEAA